MTMTRKEVCVLAGAGAAKYNRKQKQKRISEYNKTPTRCMTCTAPLVYEKRKYKFCSKKCAGVENGKRFPKRKRVPRWCVYCKKETKKYGKYCDKKCEFSHKDEKRLEKLKNGLVKDRRVLRTFLIETRGYKCELCSNNGSHNGLKLILEIDHVDGNSDDSSPKNIRFLCPNCHSQQPTSAGGIKNKKFHKRNLIMHRRSMPL